MGKVRKGTSADRPGSKKDAITKLSAPKSSFSDELAKSEQALIALAEERMSLIQRWRSAILLQPDFEEPLPTIWEQPATDVSKLDMQDTELHLQPSLANELLKTMAGVVQYSLDQLTPVVYLGPEYSYSYLAAARYFSSVANFSPVSTIAAVFEEIVRNRAQFGVVPIENSTDGRIADTLTMLSKVPVRICGEVLLPIHHCLLSRSPRTEITEVYSKPQALSQCRNWLSQNLPDARLIEISSTTAAARLAAEKAGVAAIASIEAGMHYGLNVIQKNIEDNPDNLTRFAVLGNQTSPPTANDKTTLMFQVPHKSGALAKAMQVFSKAKLNMTWIESFPIPGKSNEYLFFIEFEGHSTDKGAANAIAALGRQTLRLEILGSYPRGKAAV